MKKFRILAVLLVIAGLLFAGYLWFFHITTATKQPAPASVTETFTLDELAKYDGTDPAKPIYLAMNGLVYDVTGGRSYYETGGTYHWLAGKDSSKDLNLIGGDIIKRKYPVVGKLVQ